MTEDELHDLIEADATALSLARHGDDAGCAGRLAAIHTEAFDRYLNELSVLKVLGPLAGDAAMNALEAAPGTLIARIVRLLRTDRGLNVSDPASVAVLDTLQQAGVLQAEWVSALKASGVRPLTVTADDVGRAWARHRPDGRAEEA